MEDIAVRALEWGILFTALMITLLIFAAAALIRGIAGLLSYPLGKIPLVGDDIVSWIRDRVADGATAIYNAVIGWYYDGVNPLWAAMHETSHNQRTGAWQQANALNQVATAVAYVSGNTVQAPTIQTQPAVTSALSALGVRLEEEMVGVANHAVQIAESYTTEVADWASTQFNAQDGYNHAEQTYVLGALAREQGERTVAVAGALVHANTVATAALAEAQREVSQVDQNIRGQLEAAKSALAGAITSEGATRQQQIDTLTSNVGVFETGMAALLTTHILPAVEEVEKVGFECLDNLCGGLGGMAAQATDLLNLFEIGAIAALIYEAVTNPEQAATFVREEAQDFIDAGTSLVRATFNVG